MYLYTYIYIYIYMYVYIPIYRVAGKATFFGPRGVTVDEYGYVFVADTLNNAIRMIRPDGMVVTVAGLGPGAQGEGFMDGLCKSASFSNPFGLAVKHEIIKGVDVTVVIVADTANHRIRRIHFNLLNAKTR
jgi:hypothetical protein